MLVYFDWKVDGVKVFKLNLYLDTDYILQATICIRARLAQLVEHSTDTRAVHGSNP